MPYSLTEINQTRIANKLAPLTKAQAHSAVIALPNAHKLNVTEYLTFYVPAPEPIIKYIERPQSAPSYAAPQSTPSAPALLPFPIIIPWGTC